MKNTKIRKHRAGDIILQEGDYNKTLHKILYGKVALYLNYGKANEYLIETLSFPQYFGEVSILTQHPCYCSAVAIEDTGILHIAAENFEEFIQSNTQNAILIMKTMAKSLDSLNLLLHQTLQSNELTQNKDAMVHNIIQNTEKEVLEAEAAHHILPEVYPDFYLPGHKCYPNMTHPEYKEFLFHKEYTCPNCSQTFNGSRISYNRLAADPALSKKMRLDFHIFYKDFEPEWYDVVTCPHCYFSTLIDMFLKPTYVRKELFREQLMQIRSSLILDFSAERTLDFVFLQHYIALACSSAFSNHRQIDACLWMNLCWLYRSVQDQEMISLAEDKTIEAYKDMYLNCSLTTEQEQRTCLTIAGMYFDKEDFAAAREWAFAACAHQEGKVIYRNLAQSLIDETRYLISEKKKEEEARALAEERKAEEASKLENRKETARREAEARKEEKLRKKEEAKIEDAVKREEVRKEAETARKGWFAQGGHALT